MKTRNTFLDEKQKRKANFSMFENELGLFCIDQAPVMPEMQESTFPAHVSLAMMYVPFQRFENLYEPEKALERGTLFADLDLPFYGSKKWGNK